MFNAGVMGVNYVEMKNILIVEDELDIAEMLELYLRNEGFSTERALDGQRALVLWRAVQPELILLDIGLPELDGLEVLKKIRSESNVPIVLLTARAEEIDELLGLGLGADDYITKPFSPRTLLARVKTVLRRSNDSAVASKVIRVGSLCIDVDKVLASVDDKPLQLTKTEFKMLHYLARSAGWALSRQDLFDEAMPESDALERAVDVHMKNLRQKLVNTSAAELLETVRGFGYRIKDV